MATTVWETCRLRRTTFTLQELLAFRAGEECRRDLAVFDYSGGRCPAAACLPSSGEKQGAGTLSLCHFGDASRCRQGVLCTMCHTAAEFYYHPANYKREMCPHWGHLWTYPECVRCDVSPGGDSNCAAAYRLMEAQRLRFERASIEEIDAAALQLQQCPFYHTASEHEAWAAWRRSYSGFSAAATTARQIAEVCAPQLAASGEFFPQLAAAVDSHRENVRHAISWRESAMQGSSDRAAAAEPVVVEQLNTLVIAALIDMGLRSPSSTHRAVCHLTLFPQTHPVEQWNLALRIPSSSLPPASPAAAVADRRQADDGPDDPELCRSSDAMMVIPLETALGPELCQRATAVGGIVEINILTQTGDLSWLLQLPHKRALAAWLAGFQRPAEPSAPATDESPARVGLPLLLTSVRLWHHCCGPEPLRSDNPHFYLRYLADVATALSAAATRHTVHVISDEAGRLLVPGSGQAQRPEVWRSTLPPADGVVPLPSAAPAPSFLAVLQPVLLRCVAHWLVTERWITKRHINTPAIVAWMDQHQ
jgi:hypothetical protein